MQELESKLEENIFKHSFIQNEINFRDIFYLVWTEKWLLLIVTVVIMFFGAFHAYTIIPQYKANVLLQVEDKHAGMGALTSNISLGMTNAINPADVQMALIKSRFILAPTVDELNLNISTQRRYFPFFGKYYSRTHQKTLSKPLFGLSQYDWGGQKLTIEKMAISKDKEGEIFKLIAGKNGSYQLLTAKHQLLLDGKVGKIYEIFDSGGYLKILISEMTANPGAEFFIIKDSSNKIAEQLAKSLEITDISDNEKTGVLRLSLKGSNPDFIVKLLNSVAKNAFLKDSERKSIEAAKTLEFLKKQLPETRASLSAAEFSLNEYRAKKGNIDLLLGSSAILKQILEIQKALINTNLKRSAMLENYMPQHPFIMSLDQKKILLERELLSLQNKLKKLPASDQVVINMMRDIKVKNTLYLLLLSKIQELEMSKAGTLSDIRILSLANSTAEELPTGRGTILMGSLLLGLILGSAIIFIRKIFHRTIQDPNWLENRFGIPTFAIVPFSQTQKRIIKSNQNLKNQSLEMLAETNSRDVAIESLRSLRTSLQFALIGAKNNIISILGISPSVGKSFVSANFSYVLAETGKKVLLIDGDMRKGYLNKYFNGKREPGLSEIISGSVRLQDGIQKTKLSQLDFISSGKYPPNPSELLTSEHFKEILFSLSNQYDLIIIDTPPILAATDCTLIGIQASVNFLLIGAGKHQAEEIDLAVKRVMNNGVKIQGSIFNNSSAKESSQAHGRYNYYYAYGDDSTKVEN